jgi:ribosomal protein S17
MSRATDKTVVVRVTPAVYKQLVQRSERAERSMAQTIRLAIRQYLATNSETVR